MADDKSAAAGAASPPQLPETTRIVGVAAAAAAKLEEKPLSSGGQVIVLAMDASQEAEYAINWYIDHVHQKGNKLVFVHVIELPEMKLNQARSLHMSPGVLAGMWKEEEARTKVLETKLKELLKSRGISGVLRTSTGKPGEAICRIAEEEDAQMIISGTRGMGKVRRTILGSVTDYLVNHAHCPVVVCRHPHEKKSRRWSFGSDGKKSRHASGDKSRHTSGDTRQRNASGDVTNKQRHQSGDPSKKVVKEKASGDAKKERSKSFDEVFE